MISINSNFDGGNIELNDLSSLKNPSGISLNIRKDHQSDFYQWFYFRLSGAKGQNCVMTIENAGGASYLQGWEDYRAVASVDRLNWFRVPTRYDNGKLIITHTPETDSLYYAYFAPYTMERHNDLIADYIQDPDISLTVVGQTLDGQDIDVLTIGEMDTSKLQYWITARQHPGETMAEWWIEGFLDRLCDPDDPVSRSLRDKAVFHIVPNMNPDGSKRGHLRTNAAGINLNREWDKATIEKSPEVFHVQTMMKKTGVHFALDVHGDEALPYNFIAGAEGVPSFTDHDQDLLDSFLAGYKKSSPDFQTRYGYPKDKPGSANLGICTNYMAETFRCLAMTLEMPFKDTVETPDLVFGWSPSRCQKLGAASLDPMLWVMDKIKR